MNNTPWNLIQNKLQNPNAEDYELQAWLNKDVENKALWEEIEIIYATTGNVPDSFVTSKDQAWENVKRRISGKVYRIGFSGLLRNIAASFLLIAVGVGGSLFFRIEKPTISYTEVFSPYGHKTMVILPDSSQVWLNGNSKLKYCSNFTDSRKVELNGEAMFKVRKNPEKQFVVTAHDLQIKVYGTTFNVKSYPEDIKAEVALVEGKVGVFHDQQLLTNMTQGEIVTYDSHSNTYDNIKGDINQITSWRADELIISNESFENIAKYLERWYGVEITLDESVKLNSKLSFKVKTESLTELLSIIDHISPVSYEINGKQVKITKRVTNTYRSSK